MPTIFTKVAEAVKGLTTEQHPLVKEAVNKVAMLELEKMINATAQDHNKFAAAKGKVDALLKSAEMNPEDQVKAEESFNLWNTMKENPVTSAVAGMGLIGGASLAANSALDQFATKSNLAVAQGATPGLWQGAFNPFGINPETFQGITAPVNALATGAEYGLTQEIENLTVQADDIARQLQNARVSADPNAGRLAAKLEGQYENLVDKLNVAQRNLNAKSFLKSPEMLKANRDMIGSITEASEKALARGKGKMLGLGLASGLLGLGAYAWNKEDSIPKEFAGMDNVKVDMSEDRVDARPYQDPLQAMALGGAAGLGLYTGANMLISGNMPSFGKAMTAASAGAGLSGLAATVYNNLTTDYAQTAQGVNAPLTI